MNHLFTASLTLIHGTISWLPIYCYLLEINGFLHKRLEGRGLWQLIFNRVLVKSLVRDGKCEQSQCWAILK